MGEAKSRREAHDLARRLEVFAQSLRARALAEAPDILEQFLDDASRHCPRGKIIENQFPFERRHRDQSEPETVGVVLDQCRTGQRRCGSGPSGIAAVFGDQTADEVVWKLELMADAPD